MCMLVYDIIKCIKTHRGARQGGQNLYEPPTIYSGGCDSVVERRTGDRVDQRSNPAGGTSLHVYEVACAPTNKR